jgi:hypothetical protein
VAGSEFVSPPASQAVSAPTRIVLVRPLRSSGFTSTMSALALVALSTSAPGSNPPAPQVSRAPAPPMSTASGLSAAEKPLVLPAAIWN